MFYGNIYTHVARIGRNRICPQNKLPGEKILLKNITYKISCMDNNPVIKNLCTYDPDPQRPQLIFYYHLSPALKQFFTNLPCILLTKIILE